MSATCSRICVKYKALKPVNIGRYTSGQKRCNSCNIFIFWDGIWCPCCHDRLRLTPRSSKYKQKYQKVKSKKQGILFIGV